MITLRGKHNFVLVLCIVFRLLIWAAFGPVAMVANLAATTMIFWSTQLVNAVCHLPNVGYRSHNTREQSRNVWFVGLLALGEGWHNNHHAAPKSARHGMAWFEVDVTWYAVWLLEKVGLAKAVVRPPKALQRAAAMELIEPFSFDPAPDLQTISSLSKNS